MSFPASSRDARGRWPGAEGRGLGALRSSGTECARSLRYDGRSARVRSRPGRIRTAEFPDLALIADGLATQRVILDGELVCLDTEGKPISPCVGASPLARNAPRTFSS